MQQQASATVGSDVSDLSRPVVFDRVSTLASCEPVITMSI